VRALPPASIVSAYDAFDGEILGQYLGKVVHLVLACADAPTRCGGKWQDVTLLLGVSARSGIAGKRAVERAFRVILPPLSPPRLA